MAVVLELRDVKNLPGGRAPRYCLIDFRGSVQKTKVLIKKDIVTFGEVSLDLSVDRKI
jgi:hypothetical protein